MERPDEREQYQQHLRASPKPHPELKRLEPLVGKWRSDDQTDDSALGAGVSVESIETFTWLDGGYFLVSTSILAALPIWDEGWGGSPALNGVASFLIKDIALLGISLVKSGRRVWQNGPRT